MTSPKVDPIDVLLAAALDVSNGHSADDAGRCVRCQRGNAGERCLPFRTANQVLEMWDEIPYLRVAGSLARHDDSQVA